MVAGVYRRLLDAGGGVNTPKPIKKKRQGELDQLRERWGRERSRPMQRRPIEPLTDSELHRAYERIGHLAAHLSLLQTQVREAPELYCPMLLAGLIDRLLRHFPGIELSRGLKSTLAANYADPKDWVPDHDAPIAFFRDLVMAEELLAVADWHYLLAQYFRVKMITAAQNNALNKKFKQNRPIDAYADPMVNIEMTAASIAIEARFREVLATYYHEPAAIETEATPNRTAVRS